MSHSARTSDVDLLLDGVHLCELYDVNVAQTADRETSTVLFTISVSVNLVDDNRQVLYSALLADSVEWRLVRDGSDITWRGTVTEVVERMAVGEVQTAGVRLTARVPVTALREQLRVGEFTRRLLGDDNG